MTLFVYDGRNLEGPVRGQIKADTLQSAIEFLRSQQIEIYDLRPADWRESVVRHRIFLIVVTLAAVASTWVVRWTQRQQAANAVHTALAWTALEDGRLLGIDPTTHETVFTRRLDGTPIDMKLSADQHTLVVLVDKSSHLIALNLTDVNAPPRDIGLRSTGIRLFSMPGGDLLHALEPTCFYGVGRQFAVGKRLRRY